MISDKIEKEILIQKLKKYSQELTPYIIFLISFLATYILNIRYNNDTNLFNDKLIDVCSIFFGVFIGSTILFKKLKDTYKEFIVFSRKLLIQNLILIFLSFFIILFNDNFPEKITIYNEYCIRPKSGVFSLYVGIFSVTLWNIYRFITMITEILIKEKE